MEPVAPDALEVKIADALEAEFGVRPVISCSEELPAEAGAETTCELTTEDDPDTVFPVTATVTAVDSGSGEVEFDVEVAEVPQDSEAPQEQDSPTEEPDSPTEESTD
ncbi:hypothetical protein GCM10023169_39530 [Georgenia halophila]|uniref:DUF4333 domain-containing protein n=1 Tax=Georgenia halophila TaxID=620889 RepID=A0ABP8LPT8_9MICO